MAQAAGQAAGMAVGAAVGTMVGVGPIAGAAIGGSLAGGYQSYSLAEEQNRRQMQAINKQHEMARIQAAEQAAIHARKFRQTLASQMSLATMRGGAGSMGAQFGSQAMQSFEQDQEAIERGVQLADIQRNLSEADATARLKAAELGAIGNVISAFSSINLSKPRVPNA